MDDTYVTDTCVFIDLHKWYPKHAFPPVWKRLEKLAKEDRIIAPTMVKDEILGDSEFLHDWGTEHGVFRNDKHLARIVAEIVEKHPYYAIHSDRDLADPYVVALAIHAGRLGKSVIVTQEKGRKFKGTDRAAGGSRRSRDGGQEKTQPKIPDVADEYDIESCSLSELFKREGLVRARDFVADSREF